MIGLHARPIISHGALVIPATGPTPQRLPLHRGLGFRPIAFHPDEPWRLICTLALGPAEHLPAAPAMAVTLSAERLRLIARQMLEAADELDIKPTKDPRK